MRGPAQAWRVIPHLPAGFAFKPPPDRACRRQRQGDKGRHAWHGDRHRPNLSARACTRRRRVAYAPEPMVREDLRTGLLKWMLPQATIREDGLFVYFPKRASMVPKLRTSIDAARGCCGRGESLCRRSLGICLDQVSDGSQDAEHYAVRLSAPFQLCELDRHLLVGHGFVRHRRLESSG